MAKKLNSIQMRARQFSKLARHIRKRNKDGNAEEIIADIANLRNLESQIHIEIAPEIEAMIAAQAYADNGYRSLLPNKPEMYGLSVASQQKKYHNPLACHSGKNDADAEMDWQGQAIVSASIHAGDVEKPL